MNHRILILATTFMTVGIVSSTTKSDNEEFHQLEIDNSFEIQTKAEVLEPKATFSNVLKGIQNTICFSEINNARAANGKGSVSTNSQVEQAAYNHNVWMVQNNCFSHQCSGEPPVGERLSATGYRWSGVGEILAAGSSDCIGKVNQWLNSQGHKDIMLGNYAHVGCSGLTCDNCQFKKYWTCVFANSF